MNEPTCMLSINVCVNHRWVFPSWHKENRRQAAKAVCSPERMVQGPLPLLPPGPRDMPPELFSGSAEKALAQIMTQPQRSGSSPFQGPPRLSSRGSPARPAGVQGSFVSSSSPRPQLAWGSSCPRRPLERVYAAVILRESNTFT